jgi:hypothetical protein
MRDLKRLIADLQAILDGYKREGSLKIEVNVGRLHVCTLTIPLPKE